MNCGRSIRKGALMCANHWWKVPMPLRNRIDSMKRESVGDTLAYKIAVQAAVHAVALDEELLSSTELRRQANRLEKWHATRTALRGQLKTSYLAEVKPYVWRLKRLMADSGCDDPLFVADQAIRFDDADTDKTGRRMAAALELVDATKARRS